MTGTVAMFNNDRGFGFIRAEGGADIFFHISSVKAAGLRDLNQGDRVAFDLGVIKRGDETRPIAKKLRLAA